MSESKKKAANYSKSSEEENSYLDESETLHVTHKNGICPDWCAKCCCTSRMKFSDIESRHDLLENNFIDNEPAGDLVNEITNTIRDYRRESVLNTISEFEKKILTLGMGDDTSLDFSESEESEYEETNSRRRSEFIPKPLVLHAVQLRRATAPNNLQKEISEKINKSLKSEKI